MYLDQTDTCVEVRECIDEEACPQAARLNVSSTNPDASIGIAVQPTDTSCIVGLTALGEEHCANVSDVLPDPTTLVCVRQDGSGCPHTAQVNLTPAPGEPYLFIDVQTETCKVGLGINDGTGEEGVCIARTPACSNQTSDGCGHTAQVNLTQTGDTGPDHYYVDGEEPCGVAAGSGDEPDHSDDEDTVCLPSDALRGVCSNMAPIGEAGCEHNLTIRFGPALDNETVSLSVNAEGPCNLLVESNTTGTVCLPPDGADACSDAVDEDCPRLAQVEVGDNRTWADDDTDECETGIGAKAPGEDAPECVPSPPDPDDVACVEGQGGCEHLAQVNTTSVGNDTTGVHHAYADQNEGCLAVAGTGTEPDHSNDTDQACVPPPPDRACSNVVDDSCDHTARADTIDGNYVFADVGDPAQGEVCFGSTDEAGNEEPWRVPVIGTDLSGLNDFTGGIITFEEGCRIDVDPGAPG